MDCKTVRILLQLDHPRVPEFDAGEAEALELHLNECQDCATLAAGERAFDARLSKVMLDVPVPGTLRERLHERLEAEGQANRRPRWLRRAGTLAAAAVLLAAAWFGAAWYWQQQYARLNLHEIQAGNYGRLINPSLESVEQWLGEQAFLAQAPPDFNYDLLKDFYIDDLHGKRTPVLVFDDGKHRALVFLLGNDRFDLQALADGPDEIGSGCRVEVRFHPTDKRLAYVAVYTGDSLKPFLVRDSKRTI